jgi:hypothetical protein
MINVLRVIGTTELALHSSNMFYFGGAGSLALVAVFMYHLFLTCFFGGGAFILARTAGLLEIAPGLLLTWFLAQGTGTRLDLRWCWYIALIRKCCPCCE